MKIKGFTPIFDSLAQKYDPYTALVYGKIWRICDWSDTGICNMANDKIADQIGLSEKTIRRKKEKLAEDKLIRVVGKSGVTDTVVVCHEVVMKMELDYTADLQGKGVDLQSKSADGESDKDSNNIGKDITELKKGTAKAVKKSLHLASTIQSDFQKHLGLSPNWDTKTNQQYYQFFRERYVDGQTAEMFVDWWRSDPFRAKQNISLYKVHEQWYQAFMAKQEYNPADERAEYEAKRKA
jgi:hypothetical protein